MWKPIEKLPLNRKWWIVWDADEQEPEKVRCRSNDGKFWTGDWDFELKHVTHFLDVEAPPPGEPL